MHVDLGYWKTFAQSFSWSPLMSIHVQLNWMVTFHRIACHWDCVIRMCEVGVFSLSADIGLDSSTPHQAFICCQVLAWSVLKHFSPLASSPNGKSYLKHFNWHEHCTNFCATNHTILQPLFVPTTSRGAWACLQFPLCYCRGLIPPWNRDVFLNPSGICAMDTYHTMSKGLMRFSIRDIQPCALGFPP